MSILDRLIRSASYSVLAGVWTALGGFGASVIVARTLGVNGTASVAMALWIVFFVLMVSDVGLSASLARFMKQHAPEPRRLEAFVWDRFKLLLVAIAGGLVLAAVFLAFYWPDIVGKYARDRTQALLICAVVLVCFVVHMLYVFCVQYLRGQLNFRLISRYSLVGTALQLAGVWAGSRYLGVVGALSGYVLASVPMLVVIATFRRASDPALDQERPAVRRYATSFYLAFLLSPILWVRADLLLVDQLATAQAVGLFAAASTVAALLIQVCQMICTALLPSIVHAAAEQPEAAARASATAARFGLFLLLPACLIGAALAPAAVDLVYGAAFRGAAPTAALLAVAAAPSAITLVLSGVLSAFDRNAALVRSGAVGAVLTVVLGVLFVSRFGLIGAAMGRLGAQSAVAAMNIAAANRAVPKMIQPGWFGRYLLVSATAAGAAWLAAEGGGVAGLLRGAIAGSVVFVVLTIVALRFGTDEREALLRSIGGGPPFVRRAAAVLLGR